MPVEAVRIAAGDGGDGGAGRGDLAPAAISHSLVGPLQLFDLKDLDLQGSNRFQPDPGKGADAIDAYSQPHHVELVLREAFYACRVEDMPHRLISESVGKGLGVLPEKLDLSQRECILLRVFRHCEMRKAGDNLHFRASWEVLEKGGEFIAHESQAVHAGVQLDMDGEVPDTTPLQH